MKELNHITTQGFKRFFPHLAGTIVLASAGSVAMLNKWEPAKGKPGAELVVYADKLSQGLPTVCSGITKHVSTIPVIVGEVWTKEQCREQEDNAIIRVQLTLASCFKLLPYQSVFDAGFDHAWNNGASATCNSQAMKHWNAGRWKEGCRLLAFTPAGTPQWASVKTGRVLADGKPEYKFVQGLHNRGINRVENCLKDIPLVQRGKT